MEHTPRNSSIPQEFTGPGLDRRTFIGSVGAAIGAVAASNVLFNKASAANQASQNYYYQDSFGEVAPAGEGAIAAGVYPPPVLGPLDIGPDGTTTSSTFYSPGYPQYNILLIIVDQMRNAAFWLPAANATATGQQIVNNYIPNISGLSNASFYFPHYFTAATVCGPARACLVTGLYAQQHCIFQSSLPDNTESTPPLLPYNPNWIPGSTTQTPGFPTIGNVLSQLVNANNNTSQLQYDCTWIGKWHESCVTGNNDSSIGQNGPRDYGFNPIYSIPNIWASGLSPYARSNYASPNGLENEGTGGDFLDSYAQTTPGRDVPLFSPATFHNNSAIPTFVQLNDAAIAWAFTDVWLPYANAHLNQNNGAQLTTPWFCAVSFVNPHDITNFPFSFGLTLTTNNNFSGGPPTLHGANYQPPPFSASPADYSGNDCVSGISRCSADGSFVNIPAFPSAYSALPPGAAGGAGWNYEQVGNPSLYYSNNGKPDLQYSFQVSHNGADGIIADPSVTPSAWTTFLNYYLWMQSCVDYQVGQVLGTNPSSPTTNPGLQQYPKFWKNTVVIFTSDHGEYGGSHGIHTKGGAVYEESLNVPFYVSFPGMRNNSTITSPVPITYTCSSVDVLPFLYSLALGNELWRSNGNDIVAYLSGRESILDAIYKYNHMGSILQQRRISSIPYYNNTVGPYAGTSQPFILHTSDDIAIATSGTGNRTPVPSHVIGFRTVDVSDVNTSSAPFYPSNSYGGGKLGIYSYWNTCGQMSAPVMPINTTNAPSEYEFYNYSPIPPTGSLAANPQEVGNQMFDGMGSNTTLAQLYFNDFYGIGSPGGTNVQEELYQLNAGSSPGNNTQQVQAAIQTAYESYRTFLFTNGTATGRNGTNSSC